MKSVIVNAKDIGDQSVRPLQLLFGLRPKG